MAEPVTDFDVAYQRTLHLVYQRTTPVPVIFAHVPRKGMALDDGAFAALIGGIVGVTLVAVICLILVLLWYLSRHKGSYSTNELDDDDDFNDEEESMASDTALQSKQPLKTQDEE